MLSIRPNETVDNYKYRLCMSKETAGLTWQDVSNIILENTGYSISADACRKFYAYHKNDVYNYSAENSSEEQPLIENEDYLTIQKERIKLRDERAQISGLVRALAREETLKEIALEVIDKISTKRQFTAPSVDTLKILNEAKDKTKEALLVISDWHYGLIVDVYHNKYNPEIAKERLNNLLAEVLLICEREKISQLTVINLGDLISGNIHLPLRINNRIDVITQTFEVENLLAEVIAVLCNHIPKVRYCSTTDNHSRLDANKKESLQIESFVRVIDWASPKDLKHISNFEFIENTFGNDIPSFNVFNHKIVAVHGDKDKQNNIISNLTLFAQHHWDMILSAHMHHFSADESNETTFLCNGSLMGTDDYATSLRRNSKPSQLLIISTPERVDSCIYKITL